MGYTCVFPFALLYAGHCCAPCHKELLNHNQRLISRNGITLSYKETKHLASIVRRDRVLHLHSLENHNLLTYGNLIASLNLNLDNATWKWSVHSVAISSGNALLSSSLALSLVHRVSNLDKDSISSHGVALSNENLAHEARIVGSDRVLHLHSLEDHNLIASSYLITHLNLKLDNTTWKWSNDGLTCNRTLSSSTCTSLSALDLDDNTLSLNGVTLLNDNLLNLTSEVRSDRVLHLHSLEDSNLLTYCHGVTHLNLKLDNTTWEWCKDSVAGDRLKLNALLLLE